MTKRSRGPGQLKFSATMRLPVECVIRCVDNSGVQKMGILSERGAKRRQAGISEIMAVRVQSPVPAYSGKIMCGLMVRTDRYWRRANNAVVGFTDKAAVILHPDLCWSMIDGPVAVECVACWPRVASSARAVW